MTLIAFSKSHVRHWTPQPLRTMASFAAPFFPCVHAHNPLSNELSQNQ